MKRLLTTAALLTGLVSSAVSSATVTASAEVAYTVGGAKFPGVPWYDYTQSAGIQYYPALQRVLVDYPAGIIDNFPEGAPAVGPSVQIGTEQLDAAIHNYAQGPAVAIGLSEGGLVLDAERARLASDPTAPAPDLLSFTTFGDPVGRHAFGESFLTTLFEPGTRIPFIDYDIPTPVQSQYDTTAVVAAYDGYADFPDRPDNLLASANALMGALFFHTGVAFSDPAAVPPQNVIATTNALGATQTTYLVPPRFLPLTWPLRDAGVPDDVVNQLDDALRPIVAAGYSRNDDASSRPVNIDPTRGLLPITDGAAVLQSNVDIGEIDLSPIATQINGLAQQLETVLPVAIG